MKPVPLAKTAGDHCFIEQHACKSLAIDLQTSRKLAMLKNRSKHIQSLWNQFCFLKNTVFFFLIMWTFFFFFSVITGFLTLRFLLYGLSVVFLAITMWDLSFRTGDRTLACCTDRSWSLNHCPAREAPLWNQFWQSLRLRLDINLNSILQIHLEAT